MKKVVILTLSLLILLMGTGITYAQDPEIGSKADNACNEGGTMAGKCDSPWEWVCGWYLARWEAAGGWNTSGNIINDACVSLLPPKPIIAAAIGASTATISPCTDIGIGWAIFPTNYLPVGIYPAFTDSNCTIPDLVLVVFTFFLPHVVANNPVDALAICLANGRPSLFGGPQAQVYFCT